MRASSFRLSSLKFTVLMLNRVVSVTFDVGIGTPICSNSLSICTCAVFFACSAAISARP
jgi:hypothetical protein